MTWLKKMLASLTPIATTLGEVTKPSPGRMHARMTLGTLCQLYQQVVALDVAILCLSS